MEVGNEFGFSWFGLKIEIMALDKDKKEVNIAVSCDFCVWDCGRVLRLLIFHQRRGIKSCQRLEGETL